MSQDEYLTLKKRQKEKQDLLKAKHAYHKKYKPDTDVEEVDTETLESTWMKEGDWGPAWAKVEFVSPSRTRLDRACILFPSFNPPNSM